MDGRKFSRHIHVELGEYFAQFYSLKLKGFDSRSLFEFRQSELLNFENSISRALIWPLEYPEDPSFRPYDNRGT
jgi:hypothetical protein